MLSRISCNIQVPAKKNNKELHELSWDQADFTIHLIRDRLQSYI